MHIQVYLLHAHAHAYYMRMHTTCRHFLHVMHKRCSSQRVHRQQKKKQRYLLPTQVISTHLYLQVFYNAPVFADVAKNKRALHYLIAHRSRGFSILNLVFGATDTVRINDFSAC